VEDYLSVNSLWSLREILGEEWACFDKDTIGLVGFHLRDSELFNEWQFFEADRLRRELVEILVGLALGKSAQRQFEPAIHYGRRYLALDKYNEQAHLLFVKVLTWAGQPTAAMRHYQEYLRLMKKEFDGLPSEELITLSETIKIGKAPPLPRLL